MARDERYGSEPMKAAEPGAMQGRQAKGRTTVAVVAVAGFVIAAFVAMVVVMVVILSDDGRGPSTVPEDRQPQPVVPRDPAGLNGRLELENDAADPADEQADEAEREAEGDDTAEERESNGRGD